MKYVNLPRTDRIKRKTNQWRNFIRTAKELYWKDHKKGQRSWSTTYWKERRAKIIKEKCEICDSTDKKLEIPRRTLYLLLDQWKERKKERKKDTEKLANEKINKTTICYKGAKALAAIAST